MNASQQDILDKINTAEVEQLKKKKLTLFFPDEWNFPLPNQLLLLCFPLWRHKELQRSHHLCQGHQDEVLTTPNLEVSAGGSGWLTAATSTAPETAWEWESRQGSRRSPLRLSYWTC